MSRSPSATNRLATPAFDSVFPISSYSGNADARVRELSLWANRCSTVKECQLRGLTYAARCVVKVRLVVLDKEASGRNKKPVKDGARTEGLIWAKLPLMTEQTAPSSFNGPPSAVNRVAVASQPRACSSDHDRGARLTRRQSCCSPPASFRIAASWLGFSSSTRRTACFARIDRRRKLPVTSSCAPSVTPERTVLETCSSRKKKTYSIWSKKEIEFEVIPPAPCAAGETGRVSKIRVGKEGSSVEEGRRINRAPRSRVGRGPGIQAPARAHGYMQGKVPRATTSSTPKPGRFWPRPMKSSPFRPWQIDRKRPSNRSARLYVNDLDAAPKHFPTPCASIPPRRALEAPGRDLSHDAAPASRRPRTLPEKPVPRICFFNGRALRSVAGSAA